MVKNIKTRLILKVLLFVVSLIVAAVFTVQVILDQSFTSVYEDKTMSAQRNLLEYKKSQLEEYIERQINTTSALGNSKAVEQLYIDIGVALDSSFFYNSSDIVTNERYNTVCEEKFLKKLSSTNNIECIYIIDNAFGHIIYSSSAGVKERTTSLAEGSYKDSKLAEVWKEARKDKKLSIRDLSRFSDRGDKMLFIAAPLAYNDYSSAVVAMKISESNIQRILQFEGSRKIYDEIILVGNTSSNKKNILSSSGNFKASQQEEYLKAEFLEKALVENESAFEMYEFEDGTEKQIAYTPVYGQNLNWALTLSINSDSIYSSINNVRTNSLFLSVFILLILSLLAYFFVNALVIPIFYVEENLNKLGQGVLPKKLKRSALIAELRGIIKSFQVVVDGMRGYVDFADKIGNKQLDSIYTPLSDEDVLGKSLQTMQKNLIDAEEVAKTRRSEEEKQNWMTQGIAKFGDILREHHDSLNKHSENIIVNLTNFISVNQGGIFIYNEDNPHDKHLELTASVAYGRVKFLKKKVEPEEGLIGACFLEKETIHLKNIPDDYAEITSGLGGATPKEVLIVPLKIDQNVLGVIELVSFNHFEDHIVTFVKRIAENIASSISSQKINSKTSVLLEEAKLQSEMLAAQEEEMRQNMEELQATQEESQRHEEEMQNIINTMNKAVFVADLSPEGNITSLNELFFETLGIPIYEYVEQPFEQISDALSEEELIRIVEEKSYIRKGEFRFNGKTIKVKQYFQPMLNSYDFVSKIICVAYPVDE